MTSRIPLDLVVRRRGREVSRFRAEADPGESGDLRRLLIDEVNRLRLGDKMPRDLPLYELDVHRAGSRSREFTFRAAK